LQRTTTDRLLSPPTSNNTSLLSQFQCLNKKRANETSISNSQQLCLCNNQILLTDINNQLGILIVLSVYQFLTLFRMILVLKLLHQLPICSKRYGILMMMTI